jgi:hypothetical protein
MLTSLVKTNTMIDTKIPGMAGYNKDLSISINEAKQQYQNYFWVYKG